MDFLKMRKFLDNYKEFKNTQFDGEITDEIVNEAESKLNNQIDVIEQEIECKKIKIAELQNTKEWKRYARSLRYSGWSYLILYIIFLSVVYVLFKKGIYPMRWLPEVVVLDFSNIIQLILKTALFGVVGYLIIWNLLSFYKIVIIIPQMLARKQLKRIDSLWGEKDKLLLQQNKLKIKIDNILTYRALVDETEEIITNLEWKLKRLKDGPKSETMYKECYSWVEFLYDSGCPVAEQWEYVVLKCEEAVWLTPKERQAYCIRRMKEIKKSAFENGQHINAGEYMMEYHFSGLPGIDPSVPKESPPPDGAFVPRIDVSDM